MRMCRQTRGHLTTVWAAVLAVGVALSLITGCAAAPRADEPVEVEQTQQDASTTSDAEATDDFEPFIRIDRDDPDAWQRELENTRFITKGAYELGEADPKYGIDPTFVPSTEGMDALDISGSAQFGVQQFHDLADTLRGYADGKDIYVIDCRRESHALLNERPFSWYGLHNWSNEDLSVDEVEAAEREFFGDMVGTTIQAFTKEDDNRGQMAEYDVQSFMTERELVESEGIHYVRIPVRDHSWPAPEEVDAFVDLVKGIDMDNTWLHFHCHAGKGRTTALMVAYDIMKNPTVPLEDICVRHAMLGGIYSLYTSPDAGYKVPLYEEKAQMTRLFYDYVNENRDDGYATSWSEWL